MDHSGSKEQDNGFDLDLESGTAVIHSNVERISSDKTVFFKLCDGLVSLDDKSDPLNINEGLGLGSVVMKGKKGSSAKKPPRPPRPLSLDPSDQKLIAELAMIKRARIERMKALKQKKNAKISSSSHGSFIAMLFTIIFLLVILFQGQNSGVTIHRIGSSQSKRSGLTIMQNQLYISPSDSV